MSNFVGGLRVTDTKQNVIKMGQNGRDQGHVTYFYISEAPLLSLVSMKLQTSNFAGGLRVTDTKQQVLKWAKRGVA